MFTQYHIREAYNLRKHDKTVVLELGGQQLICTTIVRCSVYNKMHPGGLAGEYCQC